MRKLSLAKKNAAFRKGVTLIELLIVMAIMTILATLSLTTVKGLLKDQKVTQAARLVEQYLESARVRALTNDRPVAVFLERVSPRGPGLTPGTFTATRLTIGEVFPPYTGDVISARGVLWDIDFDDDNDGTTPFPRHKDGFADQIRFTPSDVFSGFSTPGGFVQEGDTIEFGGHNQRFVIEDINPTADGQIAVTFFNPPSDYTQIRSARKTAGILSGSKFESRTHARMAPGIPVVVSGASDALPSHLVSSSTFQSSASGISFRVYRQPTKSMVGVVALPRGTCVDLAVSGFGQTGASVNGISPFALTSPPLAAAATPASYSRMVILFTGEGRLGGVMAETKEDGVKILSGIEASEILHLMVGRTEQVVPGDLSTPQGRKLAALQRSPDSASDRVLSNLLDPANSWISCNPFTGEIKSSRVAQVSDATLSASVAAVTADGTSSIDAVFQEARALSTAGVSE